MMATLKNVPKDFQSVTNLIKEFGIIEYESGTVNHMLEFCNRYVVTLIEDSLLYSSHAKKAAIDVDDVKLAIELQQDKNIACPPSREITATCARQRNALALPTIRSSAGLRLPPDRHSLIACNFHLKPATKKPRSVHAISRMNVQNMAPVAPMIPRPTFNVQKPSMQCPIIKFSDANKLTTHTSALSPMPIPTTIATMNSSIPSQILMPTVGILNSELKIANDVNKRLHDEDDDYDNN